MVENHKHVDVSIAGQQRGVTIENPVQAFTKGVTTASLPVRNIAKQKAKTAERLETPRLIELSGDVTGESMFDGSEDILIQTQLSPSSLLPFADPTQFGATQDGLLTINALDVNVLYVPDGTELVIGEVDNNG